MNKPTSEALREEIAEEGHRIYERLAPKYGYETRPDTKEFNPDSPNGKLMIAVYGEIINKVLDAAVEAVTDSRDIYEAIEEINILRPNK